METHIPPRLLSDHDKQEIIKCSMVNLGRLLAVGMELYFYRETDDAPTRLDITYPDGTVTHAQFVGCSPVYRVPMVRAVGPHADGSLALREVDPVITTAAEVGGDPPLGIIGAVFEDVAIEAAPVAGVLRINRGRDVRAGSHLCARQNARNDEEQPEAREIHSSRGERKCQPTNQPAAKTRKSISIFGEAVLLGQ